MSMSSIFSENTINKFESLKKILLKVAIWTMVGGVVLGAASILIGGGDSGEMISKLMGTVLLLGLMLLISVNNFRRIASRDEVVQILALVGLVTNVLWAVLWTIMIWAPELITTCGRNSYVTTMCGPSILLKIALCVSYLSSFGFFGSNIMSIFEGEKKSIIKPLKITCLVCIAYECLYGAIMIFLDFHFSEWSQRFGMLAGFVGFAWVVMVIVALVISGSEKRRLSTLQRNRNGALDNEVVNGPSIANSASSKTEEQLRAEIEEKVRREMIEKEVREQFTKEQNQNSGQ